MTFNISQYLKEKSKYVEQAMPDYLPKEAPDILLEAMQYSLFAGGKRIRPILILATVEAFDRDPREAIPVACAIEMIHTYSLIHDDLPAMDNDDFRRGKPTNHKMFGEATAILAGDALLTEAFHVVCALVDQGVNPATVIRIVKELAFYAGPAGMVGGQMADLLGEQKALQLPELQYIHEHKTADLLAFCIRAGAILGGASEDQLNFLTTFGRNVGLAFQIQDDILDIYGDEAKLGKPVGSDEENGKSTYPSLIGLERSVEELDRLVGKAKTALYQAEINHHVLEAIADYIIKRDR